MTRSVENVKCFHAGGVSQGFNEFYDVKVPGTDLVTGRAWTLADVRRKVHTDRFFAFLSCSLTKY